MLSHRDVGRPIPVHVGRRTQLIREGLVPPAARIVPSDECRNGDISQSMLVSGPNSVAYYYNKAEYQNFQKLRLLKEHLFGLALVKTGSGHDQPHILVSFCFPLERFDFPLT